MLTGNIKHTTVYGKTTATAAKTEVILEISQVVPVKQGVHSMPRYFTVDSSSSHVEENGLVLKLRDDVIEPVRPLFNFIDPPITVKRMKLQTPL